MAKGRVALPKKRRPVRVQKMLPDRQRQSIAALQLRQQSAGAQPPIDGERPTVGIPQVGLGV
jgi:hypothetical protein